MASRGSGIGAGFNFSATMSPQGVSRGGTVKTAAPGQVYGGHVKTAPSTHVTLWVLVFAELALLLLLRHTFRHHHGG